MTKRSVEKTLRDEVATATKALEVARRHEADARTRLDTVTALRAAAEAEVAGVSARLLRAMNALEAYLPLPLEPTPEPET